MSNNLKRPKSFGVTVPLEVREILEEYADMEDRSLSYIAARILTENIGEVQQRIVEARGEA